jgi:hypothetical protein
MERGIGFHVVIFLLSFLMEPRGISSHGHCHEIIGDVTGIGLYTMLASGSGQNIFMTPSSKYKGEQDKKKKKKSRSAHFLSIK